MISLDCEGKWGMADDPRILEDDSINRRSLQKAYDMLLRLLQIHQLRATFAVVGLYVAGYERTLEHLNLVKGDTCHESWLKIPKRAMTTGRHSGWFYEDLPLRIANSGYHELASHGFSHLPFCSEGFDESTAMFELASMNDLARDRGWDIESMVFPRNEVKFTNLLTRYGIHRYRLRSGAGGPLVRLSSLISELKLGMKSEAVPTRSGCIPAGVFLNWRSGARRLIPQQVTIERWRNILEHAKENDQVAHIWFHPHNLITGHRQCELVTELLTVSGEFVRRGTLQSSTFKDVQRG